MSNDHLNHDRRAGRDPVGETPLTEGVAGTHRAGAFASPNVTVFRCMNSSRLGTVPASAAALRLSQPEPQWPIPVHEIALPCTGRLQPEHLLKAFEAGADAVCVIACAGDDCHYLEGSRRADRRVEYVRELLDEIGLGGERLMVFRLAAPGQHNTPLGRTPATPSPRTQLTQEELGSRLAAICETVMAGLGALQPSPLRQGKDTVSWHHGTRWDEANGSRDTTS